MTVKDSQIEAYEKGLEQCHTEIQRLELVLREKDKTIASLRRMLQREEEFNRDLLMASGDFATDTQV